MNATPDLLGILDRYLERLGRAAPPPPHAAVVYVPHWIAARVGRQETIRFFDASARRWGFTGARVVWTGRMPPVPAKAAHRHRYQRSR